MLTKTLLLSGLLVSSITGQVAAPTSTAGMQNGRFWKAMPTKLIKDTYMLATLDVARSLQVHPLLTVPCASLNRIADSFIVQPLSVDETELELDKFYSEPSNAPVPIVLAL